MSCGDFFDCEKNKYSLEQVIKLMITTDDNGCPVMKVKEAASGVGAQRTPSRKKVSSNGSVVAGAKSVTFETDADFVGTIMGEAAQANSWYNFSAQGNDTLAAMAYTITSGSIYINKIV
jgi:hypothetical protein